MTASPATVAHADWSKHAGKRWMAYAMHRDESWAARGPERCGEGLLLSRLREAGLPRPILVGLDFPIGLPRGYARLAGIQSFPVWLRELGRGPWIDVFEVCEERSQISARRPFYPFRPGGARRRYLCEGLGLEWDDLLRRCDEARLGRRAACPLFWTLGAQQVGKAALTGWRELLQPALAHPSIGVWPFDGALGPLLSSHEIVIVETYPAELYSRVGVSPRSKANARERRGQARALIDCAGRARVKLEPSLAEAIEAGFPADRGADDGFDAVVGLLGLLDVVAAGDADFPRDDPAVCSVEGWMLGLRP